jgi:hypothetical protein
VPAEGEQARLVARDEGLERVLIATANQSDELLVTLQSQQRRPAMGARGACLFQC